MQAIKSCFVIFNLGILHTFQSDSFGGFENEKNCITIKINQSKGSIIVKKNDTAVLNWVLYGDEWNSTIDETYKKRITANNGIVEKLEFCYENTSRDDSGIYSWKDSKDITHNINFSVWYGPNEIKTSKDVKLVGVETNKPMTINCSAECNPDCIITWRKGKQTNITSSNVFDTLHLNMSGHDNGDYTCLAENPRNDSYILSKTFNIYTNYTAKINLTLQGTKTVKEYSSVNITCCVDGYPLSNISWSKENKEINAIHNVENEAMLHFKNTTCSDTGIYECSAFNGIGTKNIKLDVLCKPSLVDSNYGYGIENRIIAALKEEIKMNVSIQANPTPYVISNKSDIDANISITSNTIYNILLTKVVSSEHDFRQHYLFIGNSEGNLTIEIKIEKRKNNYAIDFKYIIGIPLILVILISILILTVIKRVKRRKDHHANSNPTNNAYTGEYRDNILYQSIETVSLQASFESLFSSSNPSLNDCHGGDVVKNPWAKTNIEEGQSNRKSDKCNRAENSGDKIKGRKPLPRPRKTKMQQENVDKVKQKASNLKNQTLPDPRGSDLETERSRPTAFDSDNSFNDEPKYNIETSTRENVNRNMEQANQSKSENETEFPRTKFDHFHAHMGQDMEQQRHLNHGIKPNRFNTEERNIPKTNSLATEHCEYFGDTEDGESVPKLELSCEDDTQKDEDDPSQYHDYMNI